MHHDSPEESGAEAVFGTGPPAVVAVVEIDDPASASALAETLGAAGLGALEITLRTDGALDAIAGARLTEALAVGAGTVVSTHLVDDAIDAGSQFLVSPTFDPDVSSRSRERGVALIPGAVTPTEVMHARHAGHREVKIFPAAAFGGLTLIASLSAVFPDVRFIPTGGITHESALDYLAHPAVAGVGGTWIAPRELIAEKDWDEIGRRARSLVDARREAGL